MAIPRGIVSRDTTAWAESLETALDGHQFWGNFLSVSLPHFVAEIRKGLDRNGPSKRRLQLWEAGEVHDLAGRILG